MPRARRATLGLLIATLIAAAVPGPAVSAEPKPGGAGSPPTASALAEGEAALGRGDLEQAAARLAEAAQQARQAKRSDQELRALLRLADAQQGLGNYPDALASLTRALQLAEEGGELRRLAATRGALGNLYIALLSLDDAERELLAAAKLAEQAQAPGLSATIHNNLGNLHAIAFDRTRDPDAAQRAAAQAADAYATALSQAEQAGDQGLEARALANSARVAAESGDAARARELLARATERVLPLEASHTGVYTLLHIGRSYELLASSSPPPDHELLRRAHRVLTLADERAAAIGDVPARAWARSYLGAVYGHAGRTEEALDLTRRALFDAQRVEVSDARYRWHAQAARLLSELGREDEALDEYQAAVELLAALRPAMTANYGAQRGSFRENAGRIYFEYVDLLLRRAARESDPAAVQADLRRVQDVMERFKAAELRDYFQDDCVDAYRQKITRLEAASHSAAIVYPVPLKDRLEILVSGPREIRQFTMPVTRKELESEVHSFRSFLEKRTTRQYIPHAQKLFLWLVAPYEAYLTELGVDTLVFVPDGALRTVPMAALHDGERFLIERWPVATTPGLELTDPQPIDREAPRIFLGGLSEAVQGFPPLQHVPEELTAIQGLYGGELLLDEGFVVGNVEQRMLNGRFSIVHIASHGEFGGDPSNTYLLTHEGRITLDQLAEYVGGTRYGGRPLELITLSACETAAGDDRAALGLAGIAVKSGARSALGSLWKVNDVAASNLVVDFYREMQDSGASRASALQHSQVDMLDDRRYRHPGYWAAFVLINDWL